MTAMRAFLVLFLLLAGGMPALAPAGGGHARYQGPHTQIDPTANLRGIFPQAESISVGIAVVPDPIVPRYRRLYDLSVEAIELGMLNAGYVLDRYSLPWDKQLEMEAKKAAQGTSTDGDSDGTNASPPTGSAQDAKAIDEPYGLLVFRCDTWRTGQCSDQGSRNDGVAAPRRGAQPQTHIRALYVVTDTATYGLSDHSLRNAAKRIRSQLSDTPPGRPEVNLLGHPACSGPTTLVVLGPNFSGGLDSFGEQVGEVTADPATGGNPITSLCLVSNGATNPTNELVEHSYPKIQYVPLALNDWQKLAHVGRLARQLLGLKETDDREFKDVVTILAEGSTFGFGVCDVPKTAEVNPDYSRQHPELETARKLCRDAHLFYFPASIADLRDEVQQQQDQINHDAHNPLRIPLPDDQLPLQMRAENGSEYPESRQSESTTASKQLALEQLLDSLNRYTAPQIMIIVATDVRDRLFLFDKLRERLPRTLFVDLDADNLVAHHTYLHATRGALAVGSAKMLISGHQARKPGTSPDQQGFWKSLVYGRRQGNSTDIYGCPGDAQAWGKGQPFSSWSSDSQAMFADSVYRMTEPGLAPVAGLPCFLPLKKPGEIGRQATLQVVTLQGLERISSAFASRQQAPVQWLLDAAEMLAPFFCIAVAWLWMSPPVPARRTGPLFSRPLWRQAGTLGAVEAPVIIYVLFTVLAVFICWVFQRVDHDNPLLFWSLGAIAFSTWGLLHCTRVLRQIRDGTAQSDSRRVLAPAILTVCAALLAGTPGWWQRVVQPISWNTASGEWGNSNTFVDYNALLFLALDPDQGLAFFLVPVIGAAALLYASVTIETAGAIVHRNATLIAAVRRASQMIFEPRPATPGVKGGLLGPLPLQAGIIGTILALTLPDLFGMTGGVRLTVFGRFASQTALVSLMATTIAAALLTCAALRAGRRVIGLSGQVRNAYLTSRNQDVSDPASEIPGFWPSGTSTPKSFPTTPVTASVSHLWPSTAALLESTQTVHWVRLLTGWLHKGCDDSDQRAALYLLFATEIGVLRWLIAGAVACSLASVAIVYLFPIESDSLLLLNVAIMITAGAIAGYMATSFEGDGVLSNVLCNRPRKGKLSITLFVFIAAPFLALSVAVAVTRIPGVVDWSGGLLGLLLGLGLHP